MRPLPATVYRENSLGPAPGQRLVNGLIIFLAICAILYARADILIPVALAILLAPVMGGLQRLRLPKVLAAVLTVVMAAMVVAVVTGFVASAVTGLAADLPAYQSNLSGKVQKLKAITTGGGTLERAVVVLENLRKQLEQPAPASRAAPAAPPAAAPVPVEIRATRGPVEALSAVLGVLIHPLTELGIVLLMLTFFLIYREDLRNRLIRLAGTGDIHRTTTTIDEAGRRLSRLFATQLMINAATSIFIGLALFIIGVPAAPLWGALTVILRFVPYVGTLLAAVFPILVAAAVGDGWSLALLTLGVMAVTETIVGQVLEPLFFGRSTGLSPVAVVIAAACLCYLTAPSAARYAYVERRIAARLPQARVLGIAWREVEGARSLLAPEHAIALLPSHAPQPATTSPQSRPSVTEATS